jgi:hypothetical protein
MRFERDSSSAQTIPWMVVATYQRSPMSSRAVSRVSMSWR